MKMRGLFLLLAAFATLFTACHNGNNHGEDAFEYCNKFRYIHVPSSAVSAYKSAEGWKEFDRENDDGVNYFDAL